MPNIVRINIDCFACKRHLFCANLKMRLKFAHLERDVRDLTKVDNLRTFQKFMQLCAGRVGQLLNIEDLSVNCGISRAVAHGWLSALEASYIIFMLHPYYNNVNKRLTKTTKLYFYDSGLACSLLRIESSEALGTSHFFGPFLKRLSWQTFISSIVTMVGNRQFTSGETIVGSMK